MYIYMVCVNIQAQYVCTYIISTYVHYLFTSVLPNVANEEAGIAQVANNNQLPESYGFSSPPKDAVTNTSSFAGWR